MWAITKKEEEAVKSAFVEFGEENKYGDGKVAYRVPQKGYKDQVDYVTTVTGSPGYALAAIGIVLLIAGTFISAGALAPAAAAAIGAVVTALGISVAVAGAILRVNIYKRVEKGTLRAEVQFAIDVVSIIGAFVQVVGTAGKAITTLSRGLGAVQRVVQIQRLDKLLLIYDAVKLITKCIGG